MEEFFSAVSNFGFPIVVAGYLLFRFERIIVELVVLMKELTESINGRDGLKDRLDKLIEK